MSIDTGKEPASDTPVTTTPISHGHSNKSIMCIQLRHSPGGAAFDAVLQPRPSLSLASPAWLKRTHPRILYYESKHTRYTFYVQLDVCIPVRQAQSSPGSVHDSFVHLKQIFYVEGRLIPDLVLGGDFMMANQVLINMDVPFVHFSDQNVIADARVFALSDQLAKPVMRETRRVRFADVYPASNPASGPPTVHPPVPSLAPRSGILKRAPTPVPGSAPASGPVSTSSQAPVSGAAAPTLTDAMRAALSVNAAAGDSLSAFEFPPHKEGQSRPNPLGSHP